MKALFPTILFAAISCFGQVTPNLPQKFMATTINSANMPGLFASPVTKTVRASGGDYTTLQAALTGQATDAPNCNEIITVDAGYTAGTLTTGSGAITWQYACPINSWVWVRSSGYASLPPQGQTICSRSISSISENSGQTTATITTSSAHGLSTGALVRLKGVTDTDFDGDYSITVTGGTTFTVPNTVAAANASSSGGYELPEALYLNPTYCPDTSNMFKIAKTSGALYDGVLVIADDTIGSHVDSSGLIITGMEITISSGAETYIAVSSGTNTGSSGNYVNHVILDRIYIHAPLSTYLVEGVEMQGPWQALVDSYVDGVMVPAATQPESHAVLIPWAPGPYKIVDNYIGGPSPTEIIFSGGGTVYVTNANPTDVEIRTNTLYADYANGATLSPGPARKNFIEFKSVQRILVDGNTSEYSWYTGTGSSQFGASITANPVTQTGECTWCLEADWTVTNNDFQHTGALIFQTEGYGEYASQAVLTQTNRIEFLNNLWRDVSENTYNIGNGGQTTSEIQMNAGYQYGGGGNPAAYGPNNVTMSHNGFYGSPSNGSYFGEFPNNTASCYTLGLGWQLQNWTYHANVTLFDKSPEMLGDCENTYDGFAASPFNLWVNNTYTGNVHVGYNSAHYTKAGAGNSFPSGSAASPPSGMFVNYAQCVTTSSGSAAPVGPVNACALQSGSTYHNSANCDNMDCGPNIANIEAAQVVANDSTNWGPRTTGEYVGSSASPGTALSKGVSVN